MVAMRSGWLALAAALLGCGTNEGTGSTAVATAGPGGGGATTDGAGAAGVGGTGGTGAGGGAGGAGAGGAGGGAVVTTITTKHRYDPGKMFGGWGPHLGHLVRAPASDGAGTTLWWVDDHCAQAGDTGPVCDVLVNHSLGYVERVGGTWLERDVVALPAGIQQNTATIVGDDGVVRTFGIDSAARVLHECTYEPALGPTGCAPLPFTLDPSSNYVGAAVSPQGHRLVWWTSVVDGGGGSFHYLIDYGGGYNGPRSGGVGGYNDASYVNIAFGGASPNAFTMHAQLVGGLAPSWTFHGVVGYGDMGTTDAVVFANALSPPAGDEVVSTNDVWTDPATGDTHLVARADSGAAIYYHRPAGGSWSGPVFSLPATYRARLFAEAGDLVLVYGPNAGGLAHRVATVADRTVGIPIDWASLAETTIDLPDGLGAVLAIYPQSEVYQSAAVAGRHVAVVGVGAENEVVHVAIGR